MHAYVNQFMYLLHELSIGFGLVVRKIPLHLWLGTSAPLHKFILAMGRGGHPSHRPHYLKVYPLPLLWTTP